MRDIVRRLAAILLVAAALLAQQGLSPSVASADPPRSDAGTAYAVVTDDGQLVFLRSYEAYANSGDEADPQVVTDICGNTWQVTKVYTGVEQTVYPNEVSTPWGRDWREITSFHVADGCLVRPASLAYLLCDLHNMTSADLTGLDTSGATAMNDLFRFDGALTSVDLGGIDTSQATTMERMFYHCASLPAADLTGLDVSSVTTMRDAFAFCESMTSVDLSGLDTSNVTDMSYLFSYCTSLETIGLAGFDTSSAQSTGRMFQSCTSLTSLDLSSFDTSAATDMVLMFGYCDQLSEIQLGESFRFRGAGIEDDSHCAKLPANYDEPYEGTWCMTGDVTTALSPDDLLDAYDGSTMAGTWVWTVRHTCSVTCDLAGGVHPFGWTYQITYTEGYERELPGVNDSPYPAPVRDGHEFTGWMDEDGNSIEVISARSTGDRTVTATWAEVHNSTWPDLEGEAYACYVKTGRTLYLFRSNDAIVDGQEQTATDIYGRSYTGVMWGGIETSTYASAEDVPWYTSDGSVRPSRFEIGYRNTIRPISCAWWLGCVGDYISYVGLDGLDTSHCTNMASMFRDCGNVWSLDVSGFDTSQVTDMSAMFAGCSYLSSLDCSGFDTSNVTTMGDHSSDDGMFSGCSGLRTLDITGWDTSHVSDMSGLFRGCYKLNPVPAGQLDTSACTDMRHMFASCSAATSLDLSGFDTSHVTNMASMFYRCSKLSSLDIEPFDTSLVTDMSAMFKECSTLTSLDLSPLETQAATTMAQMFWGCSKLASLDISSFDTSNVTTLANTFYQCSALEEVVLGEDFSFAGGGITDSSLKAMLPVPPTDDTHNGKWSPQNDPDTTYLASSLRDAYDGSTMAGTWVWGTHRTYALTFDLAGGSLVEGEVYPTAYVSEHEQLLPGYEGTGLSFPIRDGYRFARWIDEDGRQAERIERTSAGPRTFTAEWQPLQIEVRVPVAATFVATQDAGGAIDLVPEDGDFSLYIENHSVVPISTTLRATAADGFGLSGAEELADGQADVWLTPVTTDSDPKASGYDPAQDETYHAYDQIKLSQCGDGTQLEPTMDFYDRIWLNGLGGKMGGWSANDGSKKLLTQIHWTFAIAQQP